MKVLNPQYFAFRVEMAFEALETNLELLGIVSFALCDPIQLKGQRLISEP